MTTLGFQVGWLAVCVTIIGLSAALVSAWSARRAARSAVVVLAGAVIVLHALTLVVFCAWPDLTQWWPSTQPKAVTEVAEMAPSSTSAATKESANQTWTFFSPLDVIKNLPARTRNSAAASQIVGTAAVVYVIGVAFALLRLLLGWQAIRIMRRRGVLITDKELLVTADSMRQIVGCSRRPELRECRETGLAATAGWRRPVIFLPQEWRQWSRGELEAVLAHELAHIKSRDYLICVCARFCQALHFYHPLVHWLARQLRWQQELAADEKAASLHGDRRDYVKALASLALRTPERTPAAAMPWPALTSGNLLGRIQMLREARKCRPLGWSMRVMAIGVMAGAAFLLAALGSRATPVDPPSETTEPFEIGYLPADCKAFVGFRPAAFFTQPGMKKLGGFFDLLMSSMELGFVFWPAALSADDVDQLVLNARLLSEGTGKPKSRGLVFDANCLRLNRDFDWIAYLKNVHKQPASMSRVGQALIGTAAEWSIDVQSVQRDGVTVYRVTWSDPRMGSDRGAYFHCPNARTLVTNGWWIRDPGPASFCKLIMGASAARRRDWGAGHEKVKLAPIAVVADNHDGHFRKLLDKDLAPPDLGNLDITRFLALGIELGEGSRTQLVLDAKSPEAANDLEKAVERYASLLLEHVRNDQTDSTSPSTFKWLDPVIRSCQCRRDGARREWVGHSSLRVRDFFPAAAEGYFEEIVGKLKSD